MKLLDHLSQIMDKRIVSAIKYTTEDLRDGVLLAFHDDTAISLVLERGYYCDAIHLSVSTEPIAPHYLYEAGLISAKELRELKEEKEAKQRAARELADRKLYLELKQRFEP
jgi:hypothetical protein